MNKINILFCTPYNNFFKDNNIGGIIIWSRNIMSQYDKGHSDNINVDLCSMDRKAYIRSSTSLFHRVWFGVKEYLHVVLNVKSYLEKKRYNVLHLSSSASLGLLKDFLILRVARKYGTSTIIHFHFGRISELSKSQNWEWWLLKKVCSLSGCIVVMDDKSKMTLERFGYANVVYLPNPVAPSVEELISQQASIKRIPRKILFVGHVIPEKGVYELIEACANIDDIQLHLVGYVEDEVKSVLLKKSNNATWLTVRGALPYNEVIKEMLSCDIFVLPSYTEGFPNVILEAMACKCPIIATNVGAIPEMLEAGRDNSAGLIIEPKNVSQLQDAIIALIDNDDIKSTLATHAYKKVNSHYTTKIIYSEIEKLWIQQDLQK